MTVIIDYGVGNLFSLKSSLNHIGFEAEISGDADIIKKAERIILPGVGAFRDAADKLSSLRLDDVLRESKNSGKPILGICLGMQLLFDKSLEYGEYPGLGFIHGEIRHIGESIALGLKIPHIGWNSLLFPRSKPKSELYRYISEGDMVYFVHSYHACGCEDSISAYTEYSTLLTASCECGNVFGTQFHPEKSGEVGLEILRAFCGISA